VAPASVEQVQQIVRIANRHARRNFGILSLEIFSIVSRNENSRSICRMGTTTAWRWCRGPAKR
jgi:hypothetical protein